MQRALFRNATRNLDIKQLDAVKRCQAHDVKRASMKMAGVGLSPCACLQVLGFSTVDFLIEIPLKSAQGRVLLGMQDSWIHEGLCS